MLDKQKAKIQKQSKIVDYSHENGRTNGHGYTLLRVKKVNDETIFFLFFSVPFVFRPSGRNRCDETPIYRYIYFGSRGQRVISSAPPANRMSLE